MKETKTYKVTGDTPYTPVHLKVDMNQWEDRHPQEVMFALGIDYLIATPQSVADQWWFWHCSNVPEELPKGVSVLDIDSPYEFVGFGLSREDAHEIANYTYDLH